MCKGYKIMYYKISWEWRDVVSIDLPKLSPKCEGTIHV